MAFASGLMPGFATVMLCRNSFLVPHINVEISESPFLSYFLCGLSDTNKTCGSLHLRITNMFSIITAKVRRELRSTGRGLLFQWALRWIQ